VVTEYKPKKCRYLNNVRPEASRHCRGKKKKEYLRGKIDGLQLINKIKKYQKHQ
jgi:hypothetical protein